MTVGFAKVLVFALVTHQGYAMVRQYSESHDKYNTAVKLSQKADKPLLVVGGPYGSNGFRRMFSIANHGYGDTCVDLDPRACTGSKRFVQADIRSLPFSNKEFGVAYCSHVLEHMPNVPDLQKAYSELKRVADAVFICVPRRDTLLAWLAPDHHLWVKELNDHELWVEDRQTKGQYLVTTKGIWERVYGQDPQRVA